MLTRKIGKVLRGKATPFQIMLACVLGSMIGFVPGVMQAPGLLLGLLLLLLVINANLGIAAICTALAKLLSLALMPVSFQIGRVLLDGPTRPLFEWAINTPVLALFGFEYYATTGGMVIGLALGLVLGALLTGSVGRFRKVMASLEEGSERYQKFSSKKSVKLLTFVFIGGGKGKKGYDDLLSKKIGNPIRTIGVVFAVLFLALAFVGQMFLAEPILTSQLTRGLERANGATVDLESANLDLGEGTLQLTGLAMADPNALETDLFRATTITANVSGASLLTKRIALDQLVIEDASSGEQRAAPGSIVGPPPQPAPAPPTGDEEKTIDDYIAEAEKWKERLAQAREWLEKVGQREPGEDLPPEQRRETLKERLAREVREKGYARVKAEHLIEGAPTFLISDLEALGVRAAQLEGEVLDIRGTNLSTHPHLVEGQTDLEITSRSGNLEARTSIGAADSSLLLRYDGLDADTVGEQLTVMGDPPISGGTIDLLLDGAWSDQGVGTLDLPLRVTLNDTTLRLPGTGEEADVDEFTLPITLRGPIDNPAITIDDDALADALLQAGADELANRARDEIDKAVGEEAGEAVNEATKRLRDMFPGRKKDDGDDGDGGGS